MYPVLMLTGQQPGRPLGLSGGLREARIAERLSLRRRPVAVASIRVTYRGWSAANPHSRSPRCAGWRRCWVWMTWINSSRRSIRPVRKRVMVKTPPIDVSRAGPSGLPLTLSVPEAARVLGVGRGLAYELVRRGELPSLRGPRPQDRRTNSGAARPALRIRPSAPDRTTS